MESEEKIGRRADALRDWQLLALASAAYLALGLAAGPDTFARLRPGPAVVASAVSAGVLYVLISLAVVALVSRMALSWPRQLGAALAFAAVFAGARVAHFTLVGDLGLVLAAVFAGSLASRAIREGNLLLPVVVTAAAVDTWGVYWGFVAEVAKKAPQVVQQFSAAVPGAGAKGVPVPLLSAVGIGDFIFMALFAAAVYRLRMNFRGTLWALFAVYLAVPAGFALVSAATGMPVPVLPGLVFLGSAVIIANWRRFHFVRAEKYALLYAVVVIALIIVAAWGVKRALTQ